jgi:hypothetical protein
MSNISIATFNQNFTTYVRGFETGHIDETGRYDFGVGFNVVCKNNNRVMYFESHLNSNVLPANFTQSNVIDTAWSNVLSNVKSWASIVNNSSNIIGVNYIPSVATNSNLDFTSTSNFNYNTFSSNFTVTLQKMETYPVNNPSCWCVGYSVCKNNNYSVNMMVDTQVVVNTFAVYRAEQEIMDLAWAKVKETIGAWAQLKYNDYSMLNTTFNSSNW